MPELPEVETVARGLAARVVGDAIESVWLGSKPQTWKSAPDEVARVLTGARLAAIRREGKQVVIDLAHGRARKVREQWIVHLGMTGRLLVTRPEAEVEKHTHLIARLRSGREIRFVDPRRFGRVSVREFAAHEQHYEPLHVDFERFAALFRKRKTPMKAALLDQKRLRGIGNIYADEALFRAGVRPRRRAGTLTRAELQRLYQSIQEVLREAIAAGGTTVSDYVDAEGAEGFFQLQLRVYQRTGEPCLVCRTPIKRVVVGGRSTHYCPQCQG
jgi:formamidopyrimidine-DNA glycosylase